MLEGTSGRRHSTADGLAGLGTWRRWHREWRISGRPPFRRKAIDDMHSALRFLGSPEFRRVPRQRVFTLLCAVLGANMGSTGFTDEQLEETSHDLALQYCFVKPQHQSAVAGIIRAAAQAPGGDIFEKMSKRDKKRAREQIHSAVMATHPSSMASLRRDLLLLANRATLQAGQRQRAGKGGEGKKGEERGEASQLAWWSEEEAALSTVLSSVAAAATVHHVSAPLDLFMAWTKKELEQGVAAGRSALSEKKVRGMGALGADGDESLVFILFSRR